MDAAFDIGRGPIVSSCQKRGVGRSPAAQRLAYLALSRMPVAQAPVGTADSDQVVCPLSAGQRQIEPGFRLIVSAQMLRHRAEFVGVEQEFPGGLQKCAEQQPR